MINQTIANRAAGCYWSSCGTLEDPYPEGAFCAAYFCENPKREPATFHLCRYMVGHECELHAPWSGVENLEEVI